MAFYKSDGTTILKAPNFVAAPSYTLEATEKDDYDLPVDGWYWFESDPEASTFFGIPIGIEERLSNPWAAFVDGLPPDVSAIVTVGNPLVMARLLRLESGRTEFKGASDSLITAWNTALPALSADQINALNTLATQHSIPLVLNPDGSMEVANV
jgi:hypothetical protein